jgi:polyisoprenoid-binding protein YceI
MTTIATIKLGRYDIDTTASTITFRTRHLFGLAPVRGSFDVHSGTVDICDPTAESRVHVQVDATSFRTRNRQRDANVRSARFLDTDRFPSITFVGDRLDGQRLTGQLTVRDVTVPVTLTIERTSYDAGLITARAKTRIDRTEFGITAQRGMAGRYLDLVIDVRCTRR